jgi:carbon monoxide dehydrogenase subunit G
MELTNDFRVSAPVETAWAVLTDLERIAPCMPGAELQEVEGDEYRGVVKVKVGPITAQYKGAARIVEQDEGARRAVVKAEGRETRGQGNASATITATLQPDADGTQVRVVTDLTVTGRVAQFGRGVLADVSAKLLQQFTDCLEADVLASASAAAASPATPAAGDGHRPAPTASAPVGDARVEPATEPATTARRIESRPAEPVDLMRTAGSPVAKRAAPIVAVIFLLWWLLRRRGK